MATTTTTQYFDDIDGSTEDVRTVSFSVDGAHYEIDLSEQNHARLTEALAVFVGHARKALWDSYRRFLVLALLDSGGTKVR